MIKFCGTNGDYPTIVNICRCFIFISLLLLVQITSNYLFEPGYSGYAAIFFIGILASVILLVKTIRHENTFRFSVIDLSLIVFVLLLCIRWTGSDNTWIYSKAAIAVTVVPTYFFIKQFKAIDLIQWDILFTGVVQVVVSFLQLSGLLQNTHGLFKMGGTVGNPNILAMLLLFTILSAIYLLHQTQSVLTRNFLLTYILLALLTILLTQCRTALIGSIVVGAFFLFRSKWISSHRTVKLVLIGILVITLSVFLILMFEKSASITGRLLIWQSCFVKIIEKPIWGYGVSSFHLVYPEAQRCFLEEFPNEAYMQVAGDPNRAFNDFIELWLEGGILTAMSFLLVLISVVYCWKARKHANTNGNAIAFLSATIFFILSIFNFAFTSWPVLLIFVINLAWASQICGNQIQVKFKRRIAVWAIVATLLFVNIAVGLDTSQNLLFLYRFKKAVALPFAGQERFYNETDTKYLDYAPYTIRYAAFLIREGKSGEATGLLKKLNDKAPSYSTNFQLAEACRETGDFAQAKHFYYQALKYIPIRILPFYKLYTIAIAERNYESADLIREKILRTDFKGDPELLRYMKESVKIPPNNGISINTTQLTSFSNPQNSTK